MTDFLDKLATDAIKRVDEGYYNLRLKEERSSRSLKNSILKCRNAPIIAEIKFSSPSRGVIRENINVRKIAAMMENGGAIGLSVLTDPDNFGGSIRFLSEARNSTSLPILMKDIILSYKQIDAGSRLGADAILLITALFRRGYCEDSISEMVRYAHSKDLEVLLETRTYSEFVMANLSDAELVGINNRDLKTLKVDLNVTRKILQKSKFDDKIIVSESGIELPEHINLMREAGVQAFLVGTTIMAAGNIEEKIRELVMAYTDG